MATLTARITPGATGELHYASKAEHYIRYGQVPPTGQKLATGTADATTGVLSFAAQPSRIEFYVFDLTSKLAKKVMDSTTRGKAT